MTDTTLLLCYHDSEVPDNFLKEAHVQQLNLLER